MSEYKNIRVEKDYKKNEVKYTIFSYDKSLSKAQLCVKKYSNKYFELIDQVEKNVGKPIEDLPHLLVYADGKVRDTNLYTITFNEEKISEMHPDVDAYCRDSFYINSSCYRTKDGYLYFWGEDYQQKYATVEDDGEPTDRRFIHREVAKAFVPNPDPKVFTCVDHIDKNKDNNHYTNLRWTSRSLNQRNQKISSRNKSGVIGVSYRKNGNAWVAQWYDNARKLQRKQYSINQYGNEQAKELAIKCRKENELINNYMCSYDALEKFEEAKKNQCQV